MFPFQLDESNKVLPCQHTFCTKCLKVEIQMLLNSQQQKISGHFSKEIGAPLSGMSKTSGGANRLPPPKHPCKQDP